MALKLIVRNKVRVPVKGSIADENGKPVPFNFVLLCERVTQTQLTAAVKDPDLLASDFMLDVTNGWQEVLDAEGQPLPFSAESFAEVMESPGLPGACFQAYVKEVSVTAKN